ncbi:hypothetical protein TK11N_08220 [Tetragenococcus koreensis]|uniref:Uncharacterized protein n=1 Tax=Tetragenococcus koreensis TaxID=290335 RepID=A0AAN4UAQ8_9ENTE|nr:hypothetical protein TKO01_18620 [Tetragenococcus koreensis]GEQ48970.1 hypothetical protein TK11N_08220 [Tetragenococcus koreensis]GEQ51413.1 hypothetical protein TK12N_07570 [Tetragenococcus koreensis]GEQ53997.1 hypothetical protein TK2N_08410 [Tetragenococcus koreensis]GEQ56415.1 hypothetical protein TK4N_07580 [Tetragenococcus koreensis]
MSFFHKNSGWKNVYTSSTDIEIRCFCDIVNLIDYRFNMVNNLIGERMSQNDIGKNYIC